MTVDDQGCSVCQSDTVLKNTSKYDPSMVNMLEVICVLLYMDRSKRYLKV